MRDQARPRRSLFAVWRWRKRLLFLTGATCFLVSYEIAYYSLVTRNVIRQSENSAVSGPAEVNARYYRLTRIIPPPLREIVVLLFEPAHRIDRQFRREFWAVQPADLKP